MVNILTIYRASKNGEKKPENLMEAGKKYEESAEKEMQIVLTSFIVL